MSFSAKQLIAIKREMKMKMTTKVNVSRLCS